MGNDWVIQAESFIEFSISEFSLRCILINSIHLSLYFSFFPVLLDPSTILSSQLQALFFKPLGPFSVFCTWWVRDHLLQHGHPLVDRTAGTNWLHLLQNLSVANSSPARVGADFMGPPAMLGLVCGVLVLLCCVQSQCCEFMSRLANTISLETSTLPGSHGLFFNSNPEPMERGWDIAVLWSFL